MKNLTVIGKRWFERTNGNTYHSIEIIADNEQMASGIHYGYGSMYLQTAIEILEKAGKLPGIEHYPHGGAESLWRYCERMGINFNDRVYDVKRKRDLK